MRTTALFAFLALTTGCANPQLAAFFDRLGKASDGVAMGAAAMTYPQAPLGYAPNYYAPTTTVYEDPYQQRPAGPPQIVPPPGVKPVTGPVFRPVSSL